MKLDASKEQEYREEAKRLALLPRADQREIITLHRSIAGNAKVPKAERRAGMERAEALERFLRLKSQGAAGRRARKPATAAGKDKTARKSPRPGRKR